MPKDRFRPLNRVLAIAALASRPTLIRAGTPLWSRVVYAEHRWGPAVCAHLRFVETGGGSRPVQGTLGLA
jgi:hypothetical protein